MKFGACDEQWETKVCKPEERRSYLCVPRKKEALVLRLLSALHALGIASAETGICPCCQLDAGLAAYENTKHKRGYLLYRFSSDTFFCQEPRSLLRHVRIWFIFDIVVSIIAFDVVICVVHIIRQEDSVFVSFFKSV